MTTLASPVTRPSLAGIITAALALPMIILIFESFSSPDAHTNGFILAREFSILLFTVLFLHWMTNTEKNPLSSIGLHSRHWGKSLLLALIILIACFLVAGLTLFIFSKTGIAFGEGKEAQRFSNISPFVIFLMVFRAGLVEEIFYRGYLMERLEKLTGNWVIYFLLPLILFAAWHYRQGAGGIIISFLLGAVLAYAYWKKRDLKANIIAHFMADFIPNIILPLLSN
jgi:uncharacterized protein